MPSLLQDLEAALFGLEWDISVAEQGLEHFRRSHDVADLLRAMGGVKSARGCLARADRVLTPHQRRAKGGRR